MNYSHDAAAADGAPSTSSSSSPSISSSNVHANEISNNYLLSRIAQLESIVTNYAQHSPSNHQFNHSVKPSKPSTFNGEVGRSAQLWLFELESYFIAAGISDEDRTVFAVAMLKGEALSWAASIKLSDPRKVSWNEFKQVFLSRFYPVSTAIQSRAELLHLKQSDSINKYINTFQSILHRIDDMNESDKIFFFVDGLSSQLKTEVVKRQPKSLQDAVNIAVSVYSVNSLSDNMSTPSSSRSLFSSTPSNSTTSSSLSLPVSTNSASSTQSDSMQLDVINNEVVDNS
jgi:hypothetical protein